MEKQEDKKRPSSWNIAEDADKNRHPLCVGCPYGREHEICFPCWRYLLGQEGYR